MSEPVVRVSADLRAEANQEHAYRALQKRFRNALQLTVYEHGVLTQIVVLDHGVPRVLEVEDQPQQEKLR